MQKLFWGEIDQRNRKGFPCFQNHSITRFSGKGSVSIDFVLSWHSYSEAQRKIIFKSWTPQCADLQGVLRDPALPTRLVKLSPLLPNGPPTPPFRYGGGYAVEGVLEGCVSILALPFLAGNERTVPRPGRLLAQICYTP